MALKYKVGDKISLNVIYFSANNTYDIAPSGVSGTWENFEIIYSCSHGYGVLWHKPEICKGAFKIDSWDIDTHNQTNCLIEKLDIKHLGRYLVTGIPEAWVHPILQSNYYTLTSLYPIKYINIDLNNTNKVPVTNNGMSCNKCNMFNPYAEPNDGNKYHCYNCRS